jgi:hypothetical protein
LLDLIPYPLAEPFATLWQFLAYASLTLFLWIATGGRRPLAVPAGVIVFGGTSSDVLVASVAASLAAGALLFMQGKGAESTPLAGGRFVPPAP